MTRWGVITRMAAVTFVLFLAVNWVAYFDIYTASLGGRLLDLRPTGYVPDEVTQFSLGLSFEAREAYSNVYLILDMAFIGFLTALLWQVAALLRPRRFWWLIAGLAVAYAAADLAENYLVYHIVWGEMSYGPQASMATRLKFAALLLAGATIITCWRQKVSAP